MKKLSIKEFKAKRKAKARRRHSTTMYVPVADNVYYDGYSFRVRVTKNKKRTSVNFKHINDAVRFRNKLRQTA